MNYRKIEQTADIKAMVTPKVLEIEKGHRYIIENRYTKGFEDINFLRVMTYKEMLENNLPEDFINTQVPFEERSCENCKYYIVSEGVFTQDVAKVLVKRLEYQMEWLPNGFYNTAKKYAEGIISAFGRYEAFRSKFGFYHIPFTKEKFLDVLESISEKELLECKDLINEFFNNVLLWDTKEELLIEIKNNGE